MTPSDTSRTIPRDLPGANPENAGMDAERLDRIKEVFRTEIDDERISGGVVLVARRGKVVFEEAFGARATVPDRETATLDTIYDLASLTKPIATASAVMRLVEQGKLRLADPVEEHVPSWKPSDEETTQVQEAAQLRRLIGQGKLRLDLTSLLPGDTTSTELLERLGREGRVRLSAEASAAFLDIAPADRSSVRIRNLLTHTSGLDPFDRYYLRWPEGEARTRIIDDIATRSLRGAPGDAFIYSDLGFITLGEIVERVSGKTLSDFCRAEVFEPLGMTDTMFCPPAELTARIAPTEFRADRFEASEALKGDVATTYGQAMCRGRVHDENAAVQGGVSGHAGLFSTAGDLSRFCQMLLNEGVYGGVRIFSPLTVRAMTANQSGLDDAKRGYGWDVGSPYSGQRGDIFPTGYGHTGWTGTSVWIVPEEDLFIIILTNRVHPSGKGDSGPLRSKVANVVAASILDSNQGDSK